MAPVPTAMDFYGTPRAAGVSDAFAPQYALWSFANWGEDVLVVSSEDNRVFHYVQATPETVPVVQTGPPICNAVGVTAERHVMVVGADDRRHLLPASHRLEQPRIAD